MKLDEHLLREQVTRFYERVRADSELSPIFADHVEDWDAHVDRLCDFWSSIMLTSGRYKGNPFNAHVPFAGRLSTGLFAHWLDLWNRTARETLPPEAAAEIGEKAQRIASSLTAGLLFDPGASAPRTPHPVKNHPPKVEI